MRYCNKEFHGGDGLGNLFLKLNIIKWLQLLYRMTPTLGPHTVCLVCLPKGKLLWGHVVFQTSIAGVQQMVRPGHILHQEFQLNNLIIALVTKDAMY